MPDVSSTMMVTCASLSTVWGTTRSTRFGPTSLSLNLAFAPCEKKKSRNHESEKQIRMFKSIRADFSKRWWIFNNLAYNVTWFTTTGTKHDGIILFRLNEQISWTFCKWCCITAHTLRLAGRYLCNNVPRGISASVSRGNINSEYFFLLIDLLLMHNFDR